MPEYGREYCELNYGPQPFADGAWIDTSRWIDDEFLHIAREHARREDEIAAGGPSLLINATDTLITAIWHQRYQG